MEKHFLCALIFTMLLLTLLGACGGGSPADNTSEVVADTTQTRSNTDETQHVVPQEVTTPVPSNLILEADTNGNTGIALSWNRILGMETYIVKRSDSEHGQYEEIAQLSHNELMRFKDELLRTGTVYYYKAGAYSYDAPEDIVWSDVITVWLPEYEGYVNMDGVLYYYRDNKPATDTEVEGLYFDEDGKYTTGIPDLDRYLREITAQCTKENMSQLEKFKALYVWVIRNCEYGAVEYIDETAENWEPETALDMFETQSGNCFSYAAAVAMLGKNVGLHTRGVIGECFQTYEWVWHAWTEVIYDGEVYLCDAEMEGVFAPARDLEWDLFMKLYGSTPTEYSTEW